MPRPVAFLLNYPLADNARWKQHLIAPSDPGCVILVVSGKTHNMHYAPTYQREQREDNVRGRQVLEGIKAR